jgi:hypothetical protein
VSTYGVQNLPEQEKKEEEQEEETARKANK